MKRLALYMAAALLLGGGCKGKTGAHPGTGSKAAAAQAPAPPAYDVAPLTPMLRPGVAMELRRQLGIRSLVDLPYYDIKLEIIPLQAKLKGSYILYYLNRTGQALDRLPLLLHANTPRELGGPDSSALVEVSQARSLAGPAVKGMIKKRLTVLEVALEEPLGKGERIKLEVTFWADIRRLPAGSNDLFSQALSSMGMSGSGAGASDYGLLAVGDGIITMASALPMVAPFQRGKFDTSPPTRFGDLAYGAIRNFRARVTVPADFKVVTNLLDGQPTPLVGTNRVVYTAAGAANRDFVLVAGRDLVRKSAKLGPVTVYSTHKARDGKGGELVLKTVKQSLDLFQERFGPYPFVEIEAAEATLVGGAGGVEFPGMVLVAGMLYRPPSKSGSILGRLMKLLGGGGGGLLSGLLGGGGGAREPKDTEILPPPVGSMALMDKMVADMAVFTTAHEVAHQYFAGLVGADCRQQPALDEPLAQYAAGEYMKKVRGPVEGQRIMDLNVKMNYGIYRLMGGKDRAVARPVDSFPSPLAYAAIVYGKAPYFYHALEEKLGAAKVHRALRRAVDDNRYKIITLDRWLDSMEGALEAEDRKLIRPLAKRWFHGLHGDADLGVDGSGDKVLATLMGQHGLDDLKQAMDLFGLKPGDMFRMMMGNMMKGE